MQLQTPKIEIYRTRTFTDKLGDTFNFLRENWRTITKYTIYIMLPVSMVLAFFANHFWNGYISLITALNTAGSMDDEGILSFGLSSLATLVVGIISYMILITLLFALIRLYTVREQRLANITMDELKPEMWFCMKRCMMMTLVGLVLVIAFLALVVLMVVLLVSINGAVALLGFILLYGVAVAVMLPLTLVPSIYLLEDNIGVFEAYMKGFRLGFATWGGIFAITFVIGFITGVIQSFTMMPWYILSMVKMVINVSDKQDGSFFNSFLYDAIQYITCILTCLGYFISCIIEVVAITIQYGHASDKIDGVGVAKNIERFDEFDNF
jgi:hypothetical protein